MLTHMFLTMIPGEKYIFSCDICKKTINSLYKLKIHKALMHGIGEDKVNVQECTECSRKFGTKLDLEVLVHFISII